MEQRQKLTLFWQKTRQGEARLIRAYGNFSQVEIPGKIQGISLTEIASYCFSQSRHFPDGEIQIEWGNGEKTERDLDHLRELCGEYVTTIRLPSTIKKIGNYAFYNCRNLKELTVSEEAADIGSDVFMNCFSLGQLHLECGPKKRTGLKQILGQVSQEIKVCFWQDGQEAACLLYPQFTEGYEEITPAHIFGRSMMGQGFRARQGFLEGVVDFPMYDEVFLKACVEEEEATLLKMAEYRLKYPFGLGEKARGRYRDYICGREKKAMGYLIKEKDISMARFLAEGGYFSKDALSAGVEYALAAGYTEGAAHLLQWINQVKGNESKNRYEFDDF